MCILNELQVRLVALLQTLQQHSVLRPLQLQLPHLGMGDAREVGSFSNQTPRLVHPVPPPSWRCFHPLPMRKWFSSPYSSHLGLQLRQLGLALQQLSLKLGGAALKLPLGSQELLLVS